MADVRYRHTIQAKIVLATSSLVLTPILIFVVISHLTVKEILDKRIGEALVYQAEMIADRLRAFGWVPESAWSERILRQELNFAHTGRSNLESIIIIGRDNRVLTDSRGKLSFGDELNILRLDQVELQLAWKGQSSASVPYKGKDGRWYKPAYAPIFSEDGNVASIVRVEATADFLNAMNKVSLILTLTAFLLTGLTVMAGTMFARTIVNPIKKLANASERISSGDLDVEVNVRSRDEIGLFAKTFNQMARNLKKLYEEQAQHSRQIAELSASVAHEVRSPISAIQGFTELLEDEIKDGNQDVDSLLEYIDDIKKEIRTLNSKVTDFIHFAKPIIIEPYPVEISDVLENALSSLDKEITDKKISIVNQIPSDVPCVMGDFDQLRGLFVNILRNAIQAMSEGGVICLSASLVNGSADKDEQQFIEICVKDNGCGMTEEQLAMAFEPFFTTKGEGIGLGLAIVKKIVHAHNGDVKLESQVGNGTTVRVFLPI